MKTNFQDPGSTEILSSHVSGLQEAVGKVEDILDLDTTAETDIVLSEVYISAQDRYRIFQAPVGKRNWVASPAPVVKLNDVVISTGFSIDYGGGAIILDTNALSTDVFTASFTRTVSTGQIPAGNVKITDADGNYTSDNTEGALEEISDNIGALAGTGRIAETVKGNADDISSHLSDNTPHREAASLERKNKDTEGIWTLLEWSRADGTLYKTSTLSGGTSPNYTTRTVKFYDTNGSTLLQTIVYTLSYDVDDELESEVIQV